MVIILIKIVVDTMRDSAAAALRELYVHLFVGGLYVFSKVKILMIVKIEKQNA